MASLGLNERQRALGALVGAGIDPRSQLVVGIAASSVEDVIARCGEGPGRPSPQRSGAWSRMRAPLASLGEADVRKLGAAIDVIPSKRAA